MNQLDSFVSDGAGKSFPTCRTPAVFPRLNPRIPVSFRVLRDCDCHRSRAPFLNKFEANSQKLFEI